MTKRLSINFLLICFIFINSCGFKVADQKNGSNFFIKEINSLGDKRINFKIKNSLSINSTPNSTNILSINIETSKTKNVKEKNIKNEITKYEIILNTKLRINLINQNVSSFEINRSLSGDYLVDDSYSTTLTNEKKLIDDLINQITQRILNEIYLKLNDI